MGYQIIRSISSKDISEQLGLEHVGKEQKISSISPSTNAYDGSLTFGACVAPSVTTISKQVHERATSILSSSPRLDFVRALNFLLESGALVAKFADPLIDGSAMISISATIGPGVEIGADVTIDENVVLYPGVTVGSGTHILAGTVVGAPGFGFVKDQAGKNIRFPHLGAVRIGKNCEIGPLNNISAGTLEDTLIEDGVKTDAQVHIAHNSVVGADTLITAQAELSGGVVLGKNVWVGPGVRILQKVHVTSGVTLGIAAVVTKNCAAKGLYLGSPARLVKS